MSRKAPHQNASSKQLWPEARNRAELGPGATLASESTMTADRKAVALDAGKANSSAASFLFVGSDVDDAGLTAPQFRLLAHLKRRAGADGLIYSGTEDMADICRLEKKTVRAALRTLEQRNIVVTVYRPGLTPHRRINPVSEWKADPTQKATLPKRHPYPKDGSTPYPNGSRGVYPNGTPKGNPLKVIQEKVIHREAGASKAKRFQKPSIEELKEYGKEIGLADDRVVAFFDSQEAKGWKWGNGPMVDWRAALRYWQNNPKYAENSAPAKPVYVLKPIPPIPDYDPTTAYVPDELKTTKAGESAP